MTTATRSGLIPLYWYNGELYARCMIPSDAAYGGTLPQLAKGQLEDGLSSEENAIKEACEELGLIEDNIRDIEFFQRYGDIDVFVCFVNDHSKWNVPHWESKASLWVCLSRSCRILRPEHHALFNAVRDVYTERYKCGA